MKKVDSDLTDYREQVFNEAKGKRCIVQYRAHMADGWHTVEGSSTAQDQTVACKQAHDVGRGYLLADVGPEKITTTTNMVCSDFPEIRVRPVRIGEVIWDSETDVHTIPTERPYFWYKGTACRMFIERATVNGNLMMYQGIICRQQGDGWPTKWIVVDKY
jgi:hypothetical protein